MRLLGSKTNSLGTLLLAGMLCLHGLHAQEYRFQSFGAEQGLTNLEVRNLFQDSRGFLWVSTQEGVFRYDGNRFQAFADDVGLPLSSAVAFGELPGGSLLVGGAFGLYRFSGNRFEKVLLPGAKTVSWVGGIRSDGHGQTYLATDAGLFVLTPGQCSGDIHFDRVPTPAGISGTGFRGIVVDGDAVWYGCGEQVCRLHEGTVRVFGEAAGLTPTPWVVIGKDANGDLWVRGRGVGLASLARGGPEFQLRDTPLPPAGTSGVAAVDQDSFLLFPSPDGLIIRRRNDWWKVGRAQGLRGVSYCVLQDREGAIWVGTAGRGLVRWAGYKQWESYSADTGLASDVAYQMLPQPDGSLWVGTEAGLMRGYRSGKGYRWQKITTVGSVPIHSLAEDGDGTLWLGTEVRGVAHFDPGSGQVQWIGREQGLDGLSPYTVMIDRKRRLWAATEAGLFVAQLPFRRFQAVSPLPRERFWALAETDNGQIWAGGRDGLYRLDEDSWQHFTTHDGMGRNAVLALGSSRDVLWIGYVDSGQIDRVEVGPGKLQFTPAAQSQGASGSLTYFLGFDARGRLWAGTNHGVHVLDRGSWRAFDSNDGLAWDDCDLHGFAAEPDGSVWIGTSGGLSHYAPPTHAPPSYPLSVVFTRITLGGKDVTSSEPTSTDFHSNTLVAQYSDLNFAHGSSLSFRYRLLPLFTDWRTTDRIELEFPGIPPGEYRLEVQVRDVAGNWSPRQAEFAFQIQTPWFRSYWFLGLCVLIALALAALMVRLRIRVSRRRERELVRLVEMRTAELKRANEELYRLSATDGLTGIANRRIFDKVLHREWARLPRSMEPLSVLMLDVDHFKMLNDSEGHQYGDACLVHVAATMYQITRREIDLVARYGGEEFAAILPATGAAEALALAERIRLAIADLGLANPRSPTRPSLTVSIGVGSASKGIPGDCDTFMAAIDRALYAAKRAGRNRVVFFDPPEHDSAADAALEYGGSIS
ncbi:MAG TPA: diguanylate cyclase [Terracidiphilus sp.]|nr:diguanylate cyclase [Terracidiphilus sp.]